MKDTAKHIERRAARQAAARSRARQETYTGQALARDLENVLRELDLLEEYAPTGGQWHDTGAAWRQTCETSEPGMFGTVNRQGFCTGRRIA